MLRTLGTRSLSDATAKKSGGRSDSGTSILRRPGSSSTPGGDSFADLKSRVQNRLIAELDPRMDLSNADEVRRTVEETFNSVLESESIVLTRVERMRLFEAISAEILGFGPIEPLLNDDSVSEIMVNGPNQVYVERNGRLVMTDVRFVDDDHVMRVIDRIVSPLGRRIDESSPMVDARLPDGSRINAIIPPISLVGPVLTIESSPRIH
ncbi:MAG: ATPase, T2SS/T4P/T4SS family [Thermomicrobiales bacterium]